VEWFGQPFGALVADEDEGNTGCLENADQGAIGGPKVAAVPAVVGERGRIDEEDRGGQPVGQGY